MEEAQKAIIQQQEQVLQEIRQKENEEVKQQNSEQLQQWQAQQMQAREQMLNKRKVVKQELDVQVQARNQRLAEVREMDKLYGAAFQMKIEQDSKQH